MDDQSTRSYEDCEESYHIEVKMGRKLFFRKRRIFIKKLIYPSKDNNYINQISMNEKVQKYYFLDRATVIFHTEERRNKHSQFPFC